MPTKLRAKIVSELLEKLIQKAAETILISFSLYEIS